MLENRHRDALRRIYEADDRLRRDGRDPEAFHLRHHGGMQRAIDHPCWDPSWAVPSEQTVDDLGELGILRVEPSHNRARTFALTMDGRQQAAEHADAGPSDGHSFTDAERARYAITAQAAEDLAVEAFLSQAGATMFTPDEVASAVDNDKFDTHAAVMTLRSLHQQGRVSPGGGGWQVTLEPDRGPFFHVRSLPVDAADLPSGPLYAVDLSEQEMIERFVAPFQRGHAIEQDDRRLESYRKPTVTRTFKPGAETIDLIRDRLKRGSRVHAPSEAEELFFSKASQDVTETYLASEATVVMSASGSPEAERAIFVVHGHQRRDEVARFLQRVTGKAPIVLAERAGRGRTIIEKFEGESETASFAVVLLTADDTGRRRDEPNEQLRPRARQNVILELGYFIGRIGRENVVVLYEDEVEIPSDYEGVEYISFSDQWEARLMRELQGAGIRLDASAI